ncbi:MAG TPA: hypothetical protein VMV81_08765 [Phycisphaerae bacterium]|nr:hypothetical protein [Phycisphaerae bacterium]
MCKNTKRTGADGASDPLTPGEVGVLMRVVRARVLPEVDLVSSWGMGSWAAQALDGLLKRRLVGRLDEVSQFIGKVGVPIKPAPWIIPTKAGITAMAKEQDVAFPPSGSWLIFEGVLLNPQPPDLLMQLIEYIFVRDGMKLAADADIRPVRDLEKDLLARLGEIKTRDGPFTGDD